MRNSFESYLSKEDRLQRSICKYVKAQYGVNPIPLNTEGKKSPFERFKFKAIGGRKGILDLFIPVARKQYNGLFLELKADNVKIRKKNGEFATEHLVRQNEEIQYLLKNGYLATFCVGLDDAIKVVDDYLA